MTEGELAEMNRKFCAKLTVRVTCQICARFLGYSPESDSIDAHIILCPSCMREWR